jgi:hypothetical protein
MATSLGTPKIYDLTLILRALKTIPIYKSLNGPSYKLKNCDTYLEAMPIDPRRKPRI